MTLKFKKAKLPIWWFGKEREVDAYVLKNLMVHKIPNDEGDKKFLWTISHVGTGFCVGINYPPLRIMKEAKELVVEMVQTDDWFIPNVRLGETIRYDTDRAKVLARILNDAWNKVFPNHMSLKAAESLLSDPNTGKVAKVPKCIRCGQKPSRYALERDNKGKYGWHQYCLKCLPYDDKINKVEGEMSRW